MTTTNLEPIIHHSRVENYRFRMKSSSTDFLKSSSTKFLRFNDGKSLFCNFKHSRNLVVKATTTSSAGTATLQTASDSTYPLKRTQKVEGKISVRLDNGKNEGHGKLTVGCTLPGNWILHWGVTYIDDLGSEWDQPPLEMRPPGSMPIKDYAIETPLEISSSDKKKEEFQDVKIDIDYNNAIAAIHFVLKDQDTGAWYQHRGRDFKVPLIKNLIEDRKVVGEKRGFGIWPGYLRNYF